MLDKKDASKKCSKSYITSRAKMSHYTDNYTENAFSKMSKKMSVKMAAPLCFGKFNDFSFFEKIFTQLHKSVRVLGPPPY